MSLHVQCYDISRSAVPWINRSRRIGSRSGKHWLLVKVTIKKKVFSPRYQVRETWEYNREIWSQNLYPEI